MADGEPGDLRSRLNDGRRSQSRSSRGRTRSPPRRSRSRSRGRRTRSREDRRSRSKTNSPLRRRSRDRRSRSYRDKSISRSVSGELYRDDNNKQLRRISEIVEDQQNVILDLLSEHKAEVDQKLDQRKRRFASKQLEKQFEVNLAFKELALKVKTAILDRDSKRAESSIEKLLQQLELHEEDLTIADTSPHGWLAVAKVRGCVDLPKHLRKKLALVDKELATKKSFNGPRRRQGKFPREGEEPVIRRGDRRLSPEELLFQASKQVRSGICSHCKLAYHFYKECPTFWQKVLDSRAEKAKEETGQ